ncbi:helix-turn-helix transcriptional regulator [Phycicoccus sp.]|uniref:helix-turn-helix domain-containing protein n=1 Tax=Phycicoccus sp. TaxID=1902410 RepID=UPI002B80CFEC|nr:helix-turn-helix transcriptional regulator [Phycicoccus sp.]HMM96718.1 helix-turn-helix transcriptional regulator [Phycicoccus sp.]
MPRTTHQRVSLVEQHVARRVREERERRDWTYERLSTRMGEQGCLVHPSAIYRIEKGNPPRRITVDELVALASAFDISVASLLGVRAEGWRPEMGMKLVELERLFRRHMEIVEERSRILDGLRELVLADQVARDAFREVVDEDWDDWPEFLDWSGVSRLTGSTTRRRKGGSR